MSLIELSLISELLEIILFLILVFEWILQFCITIEFSMLETKIVELSPTLTLGPIEEFANILQLSPIITGPFSFTPDSILDFSLMTTLPVIDILLSSSFLVRYLR